MPFVDASVYTRNRAFRLYLSSKAGKDARLLPTGPLALSMCSSSQLGHAQLSARPERQVMFEGVGTRHAP